MLDRSVLTAVVAILMIILVGASQWKIRDPLYPNVAEKEHFWTYKTHCKPKYDMVLLGDSRVFRGLAPSEMEKSLTNCSILNFGYSAGGLNPTMYEAAESKIDPESRQPMIVLGISPEALTDEAAVNEQYTQELNRPKLYILSRLYAYKVMRFLSPIRIMRVIRLFVDYKRGWPYNLEYEEDGWVASWRYPADTTKSLRRYKKKFDGNQVSEELVASLMAQTSEWRKRGYLVFAFRPPTSDELFELENELSGFDEKSFIQCFTKAGGIWLPVERLMYKTYDGTHLQKQSALELSREIAEKIVQVRINSNRQSDQDKSGETVKLTNE